MKDLVEIFKEKLSHYSRLELEEKWEKYAEYAEIGPLVEDYLFGIENGIGSDNKDRKMSCSQSENYYLPNCQYNMAA